MSKSPNPIKLIKNTLKNEGLTGFFKGLPSVVSTVALVNAVVFSSYE